MKRAVLLVFCMVLLLTGCAGSASGSVPGSADWQEQYDLGLRFLSEGNYKEAVLHFTAAIRIDPKQAEAYQKAAEAYGALGDIAAARAILQQGVDAIGDSTLQSLLDALPAEDGDTPSSDIGPAPETAGIPISVDASQITGTLSLSDFTYTYEHGGEITTYNDGAVGGIHLDFTVNGPSNVSGVYIASWRENEFMQDEINQQLTMMVDVWKGQITVPSQTPPFVDGGSGPVDPEERGTKQYYLLIGLDGSGNAAGYAVVPVDVP